MGEESKQWVAVTILVFRGDRVLSMQRAATKDAGPGLWEAVSGRVLAGIRRVCFVQHDCACLFSVFLSFFLLWFRF